MTLPVSIFHNLSAQSLLPLTTFFSSGDKTIILTALLSFRQSSAICFSLLKFHTRSEYKQVMIRCPPGKCMALQIELLCPSNFWRGIITDVSFFLVVGEAMLQNLNCGVQRHLSFYPSNFKIITYEDNDDRWI
jgi:hypothetical protein